MPFWDWNTNLSFLSDVSFYSTFPLGLSQSNFKNSSTPMTQFLLYLFPWDKKKILAKC